MKRKYDYDKIERELKRKSASLERNVNYEAPSPSDYAYTERPKSGFIFSQGLRDALAFAAAVLFIAGFNIVVLKMKYFVPPTEPADSGETVFTTDAGTEETQTPYRVVEELEEAEPGKLPELLITYALDCGSFNEFTEKYGYYYEKLYENGYSKETVTAILRSWGEHIYYKDNADTANEAAAYAIYQMIVSADEECVFTDNGFGAVDKSVVSIGAGLKGIAEFLARAPVYEQYQEAVLKQRDEGGDNFIEEFASDENKGIYADNFYFRIKELDDDEKYVERVVFADSYEKLKEKYPVCAEILALYTEAKNSHEPQPRPVVTVTEEDAQFKAIFDGIAAWFAETGIKRNAPRQTILDGIGRLHAAGEGETTVGDALIGGETDDDTNGSVRVSDVIVENRFAAYYSYYKTEEKNIKEFNLSISNYSGCSFEGFELALGVTTDTPVAEAVERFGLSGLTAGTKYEYKNVKGKLWVITESSNGTDTDKLIIEYF